MGLKGGQSAARREPGLAGVDEAGRGPLAGPVAVAAVILADERDWSHVDDSKRLDAARRAEIAEEIRASCAWYVYFVHPAEIDRLNILAATLFGMQQAVRGLPTAARRVLVDGNRCPAFDVPAEAVIGGDRHHKCIGAASILAKTARDDYMRNAEARYPGYGFAQHKGYGTPEHLRALRKLGPTPEHRRSFAPVRDCLQATLFQDADG